MQLFLVLVAIPVKGLFFFCKQNFFFKVLTFPSTFQPDIKGRLLVKKKLFSAELPFELGNLAWNITLSCSKYLDGVDRHTYTKKPIVQGCVNLT